MNSQFVIIFLFTLTFTAFTTASKALEEMRMKETEKKEESEKREERKISISDYLKVRVYEERERL